jgi:Ankyrin repeats (3 copies)
MAHTRRIVVGATLVLLIAGAGLAQSTAPGEKADQLAEAARKGDAAVVKKLLDEGVDVDTKFRYSATALSYACDRGHLDVVKLLLDRGADVNVKDTFYGATPLTWAVSPAMGRKPQHPEVVRLLLQHGAQGKEQALMAALSESDAATTKVILDLGGLSPDTLSDALESATIGKHPDIASMLERAGAKPRIEFKMDPAQLARLAGTYLGTGNMAQVPVAVTTTDNRLVATINGQRLTLVARDQTTFGVAERPGTIVTFRVEQDKPIAMTLNVRGNETIFTRAGEK